MYAPEIEAQERRHERISAIITTVIVIVLLLISLMWRAFRMRVPPPGDKDYEMVGAIDFGDYSQGSRSVNNFQEAVPEPTPAPNQSSSASEAEASPASSSSSASNEMTQPDIAPVSQPEAQPAPTPDPAPSEPSPNPPTSDPSPTPSPSEESSSQPTQQQDEDLEFDISGGGSNQGDAETGTGNQGTPDVQVLDPGGLYSFAEGSEGGLEGRRPLSLPNPSYTSQQEGELTFEFVIAPDGSVSYVKALPNNKPDLANAGKAAIRRWRFNSKPGAAPQRVRVTIKFKLRG